MMGAPFAVFLFIFLLFVIVSGSSEDITSSLQKLVQQQQQKPPNRHHEDPTKKTSTTSTATATATATAASHPLTTTLHHPHFPVCRDHREDCAQRLYDCHDRRMHSYCPVTCGTCHNRTRTAQESISQVKERYMDEHPIITAIGSDLGVPQVLNDKNEAEIISVLDDARRYMQHEVMVDDLYMMVRNTCRNQHRQCAQWAVEGQCDTNHHFMSYNCAPVCWTCEYLHYNSRCPVDYNTPNALYPGDLNRLFVRILNDPIYVEQHNLTVLSRPEEYASPYDVSDVRTGSWLIQLDHFFTAAQAERLIQAGAAIGYERSQDVGDVSDMDGSVGSVINVGRTSTNAWCGHDQCEEYDEVQGILSSMERLTGIDRPHYDSMQLLRYEVGQFYEEHHDYIEVDYRRIGGSRVLTVFLYLNDVEEGGGTDFPVLDVTVTPKLGRVALWPSVRDDEPHLKDEETYHQALPVIKGIKYGANAWIHQRRVQDAYKLGC